MAKRGEVLVAIVNQTADLKIAREQHWYHIPVEQVEKLKQRGRWSPEWLAFYQTKIFGDEAYSIRYFARIHRISQVSRHELFPHEENNKKSRKKYFKLELLALEQLPQPIFSRRLRRIVFIPQLGKN